jgi:hypothetical protein
MTQPSHTNLLLRRPHFWISGAAQLFGIKAQVLASLTTSGLLFALKGRLASNVEFDLDLQFDGKGVVVDGDLRAGIGTVDLGELGRLKVNTKLEGFLGVRMRSGEFDLALAVEASFTYLDQRLQIKRYTLEAKPDALARLDDSLQAHVKAALKDMMRDANRWLEAVKRGLIEGVNDAEEVLVKYYGKTRREAESLWRGASHYGDVIVDTASSFGKKIKKLF